MFHEAWKLPKLCHFEVSFLVAVLRLLPPIFHLSPATILCRKEIRLLRSAGVSWNMSQTRRRMEQGLVAGRFSCVGRASAFLLTRCEFRACRQADGPPLQLREAVTVPAGRGRCQSARRLSGGAGALPASAGRVPEGSARHREGRHRPVPPRLRTVRRSRPAQGHMLRQLGPMQTRRHLRYLAANRWNFSSL